MRRLQGLADLEEDGAGGVEGHRDVRHDQILKGLALQELHDEVVPVVLGDVEVEDLEDVVVADDVDRSGFVEEAIDDLLVRGVLRMEELDRHARADDRMLGHVHRAHPALAEHLRHPVAADIAPDQLVVGLHRREIEAVLRAVEDLVLVLVLALGASPGQDALRRLARSGS